SVPIDNGCARAGARIQSLVAGYGNRECSLELPLGEEEALRDCTESQLGADGLCAARASRQGWRRFLVAFSPRQRVRVSFDASALRVLDAYPPLATPAVTSRPSG